MRQQNVIIGMSMGGLVARYALRDMEIIGQNHETRLFISHDAPQWGANVPVGAQAAVQHLVQWQILNLGGNFPFIRWVDMFPQVVDAQNLFNSPAAQQMLIQRYTLNGQNLVPDNTEHTNFLNEINTMGWPLNCRNIALSNGSCNGTVVFPDNSTIFTMDGGKSMTYFGSLWRRLSIALSSISALPTLATLQNPAFNRWGMYWQFPLSLYSTRSSIDLDFKIRAVPRSGTQEIYRGDVVSNKRILGLINVKNYFIKCHVNSSPEMLALDNAPGGLYDLNEFGFNVNDLTQQLPDFLAGAQASVLQPRFCFVPTVSSLGTINPQQSLFSNICNNAVCNMPNNVTDYFAPQQNQLHISFTQASTDWLLQRQNANSNCLALCAAQFAISGNESVCSTAVYSVNNVPAGASVTWSVSPNNVATVNSSGTVTKQGNGTATLTATISSCGSSVSVNKTLTMGSNWPNMNINGPQSISCGQIVTYQTSDIPGAGYQWSFPSNWIYNYGQGTSSIVLQIPDYAYSSTSGDIRLLVYDACNNTSLSTLQVYSSCGGYNFYSISPNPATSTITIFTKQNTSKDEETDKMITEINIYDQQANLKKHQKFGKVNSATLNVSELKTGIYFVEIGDGTYKERQKLIINK